MSEQNKKFTFKERVENFFYYYKWPVIFVILVALVISMYIPAIVNNEKDAVGDLTVLSVLAHPLTSEEYNIDQRLKDSIEDIDGDGEKSVVLKQFFITEKRTGDADVISTAQLDEQLRVGRGDLLILDEPNLEYYLKKDMFSPLEDYVDLSYISDEDIIRKDGVAVAVKLTSSQVLKDMRFIIDEVYAGVLFIPDNADDFTLNSRKNTTPAIKKLLEKSE